jgi:hypothetical protein
MSGRLGPNLMGKSRKPSVSAAYPYLWGRGGRT